MQFENTAAFFIVPGSKELFQRRGLNTGILGLEGRERNILLGTLYGYGSWTEGMGSETGFRSTGNPLFRKGRSYRRNSLFSAFFSG